MPIRGASRQASAPDLKAYPVSSKPLLDGPALPRAEGSLDPTG
jgi:hypothetical protein